MSSLQLNLCSLPPWAIASRHYNDHPQPLELQGLEQSGRGLLERLAAEADATRRAELFHDYMNVHFQLHQWQQEGTPSSRKSLKNSYLRFLRGWMFDSNSIEGAVLKGWVESRFGLPPTFHREPIGDIQEPAYFRYTVDRMKGSARTSAILQQLDLLYLFCQHELTRRYAGQTHLRLWRGVNDFSEHRVIQQQDRRHYLLRLNNLNSFTSSFETAWEFGNRVLQVQVPLFKVVFFSELLPSSLLKGEHEMMALGGEFAVKVLIGG